MGLLMPFYLRSEETDHCCSLAPPASSPEKPSFLAGRAFTRSALGAVCRFSTTSTIGGSGETRMSWGLCASELDWVIAALPLVTVRSVGPEEALVARAG